MVMPLKITDLAHELQTTPEALESLIRDLQSPDVVSIEEVIF
jgi:hypothetical protein